MNIGTNLSKDDWMLLCLAEECDEVGQRVTKAMRFGLDEKQPGQPFNNRDRLMFELWDLIAVAKKLVLMGILPQEDLMRPDMMESKWARLEEYWGYAQKREVADDHDS
jgi:hypothetical protein